VRQIQMIADLSFDLLVVMMYYSIGLISLLEVWVGEGMFVVTK
jgi:hypothetical protein